MFTPGHAQPEDVRKRIASTLRGRPKSADTRARMRASKLCDRKKDPERWEQIRAQAAAEIEAIERVKQAMREG